MSTFGGLNAALSGLNAARIGLETTGNNILNVNTPGYTRQRAELAATGAVASTGLLASRPGAGQGVSVSGIARLADAHLDARVNGTSSAVGLADTRAAGLMDIEATLREPGENGLSALLGGFWAGWEAVANQPGEAAPATVLISRAEAVASRLALNHSELSGQWSAQRQGLDTMASELNSTASQVAELNGRIRSTLAAGGSANEMMDQRAMLTTRIAELAGGTTRDAGDGTIEVLIAGTAMVSGTTARALQATGGSTLAAGQDAPPALAWADREGAIALDGGRLAGALSLLAAANEAGTGGRIAETARALNDVADRLLATVNDRHAGGYTADGRTGIKFFDTQPGVPAAAGLGVAIASAADLATRGSLVAGQLDASNASGIAALATAADGADKLWMATVVSAGLAAQAEAQQSVTAAVANTSALAQQQASAGVSLDEENVALLAYQHAYQGAARVMTAVDEMLDTLINRTGVVGR